MSDSDLIEIRWHGRGGQGAVTSAELLARAAISEGKYAQAFPSFGPERRGAPVVAFNRISGDHPIRNRAGITEPDVAVVLDATVLRVVKVTEGLKEGGTLVINSKRPLRGAQGGVRQPVAPGRRRRDDDRPGDTEGPHCQHDDARRA